MIKRMLLVLLLAAPVSGHAQTRSDMVESAFDFLGIDNSAGKILLYRALNPDSGFGGQTWTDGVMLLADMFNDDGDASSATAWLRWALRLAPRMTPDADFHLPETIQQFQEARVIVGSDTTPTLNTSWVWSENPTGPAVIRLAAPNPPNANVLVVQWGGTAGDDVTVAPGTQQIQGTAQGFVTRQISREALPGIITVVSLSLDAVVTDLPDDPVPEPETPEVQPPDDAPAVAFEQTLFALTSRLVLQRSGRSVCGVGVSLEPGLALTTYEAIRGAQSGSVQGVGSGSVGSSVQVAAYDVDANLAVITTGVVGEAASLAESVGVGDTVWGVGLVDCASATATTVAANGWDGSSQAGFALSDFITNQESGTPIFDASGALLGVMGNDGLVIPHRRLDNLLEDAREAVTTDNLQSLAVVAQRERHVYGTAVISSDSADARVRVTPLEDHQWQTLAGEFALPHTLEAPVGRYALELIIDGAVADRTEITVPALSREQVALMVQAGGGGFPIGIVIGILAGGGGAVCLLAVCKSTPTTEPPVTNGDKGTIIVNFPINR